MKKMLSVFSAPAPNWPITASSATRNLLRPKKRRPATSSRSTPDRRPAAFSVPLPSTGAVAEGATRTERMAMYDTR